MAGTGNATQGRACACGCGGEPRGKYSQFVQGHDAKLKSALYDEFRKGNARVQAKVTKALDQRGWPLPAVRTAKVKATTQASTAKVTSKPKAQAAVKSAKRTPKAKATTVAPENSGMHSSTAAVIAKVNAAAAAERNAHVLGPQA